MANLVTPQRVFITSDGNDSGLTWTITGTDRYSRTFSESLAGGNAVAVNTSHDFLTVTKITSSAATASTVTAGTGAVGSTDAWIIDGWANPSFIGGEANVSGTVAYNIEASYDDFSPNWDLSNNTPIWYTAISGSAGTSQQFNQQGAYTMVRLTITSGTGTVTAHIRQPYAGHTV